MSWRRLTVLIRGLSPDSHWVITHRARSHRGHRGPVNRITDPKAAEAWFSSLGRKASS